MKIEGNAAGVEASQANGESLYESAATQSGNNSAQSKDSGSMTSRILPKKDAGQLIVVKLRDLDGMTADGKTMEFVLPAETTISNFLEQVTTKTGLTTDAVSVVYQTHKGDAFDLSHFPEDSEFSVLGIYPSREKTYSLCLMKKKRTRLPTAPPTHYTAEVFVSQPKVIDPDLTKTDDDELLSREFVGLKNQQQTCYLNSLLQSLFFCPEFRNFIYNQKVPYDPQKKSLILALQKIFLQLQFSVRSSIETEELTRTFGWKEDHNFVQHDIEELYRAVLEYLGDELKRAGEPSHGDSLFGGLMNDYVKCLQCQQRNSKIELSMGISLPVRAFGEKLTHPTLEEALRNFVQVEVLTHPNQYRCERCSALVDAEKGTAFEKLPYFLSLQLRRWEFDLTVLARRKINDKISFPFILNMDPFMPDNENGDSSADDKIPAIDRNKIGSHLNAANEVRTVHSRPQAKIYNKDVETRRQGAEGAAHAYELLAVWVHEGGSSHRGHYYSYVYDLEKRSWYLCNDSFVRKSSEEEVMKTFGGHPGVGEFDRDKGEAYMLIYRKRDETLNTLPMIWDNLPDHIKELWTSMEANDRKVHEDETYEKRVRRVRLCKRKPDGWEVDTVDKAFEKMESLQKTALEAYKVFYPDVEVDPETVRLVRFNEQTLISEESWEGRDDEPFGTVVRRYGETDLETLLLEVRSPEKSFEPYTSADGILKVDLVDWRINTVLRTAEIHFPCGAAGSTLADFREKISSHFNITADNLVLARSTDGDTGSILLNDADFVVAQFQSGARLVELMVQNVEEHDVDDFLKWCSQYYGSYCFFIECQLPPPSVTESGSGHMVNDLSKRPRFRSETEPQFEFDPLEAPVLNGHVTELAESAPANGHENMVANKMASRNYFCIQGREISTDWEKLKIRVSPRTTLRELSQLLSHELDQAENDFNLFGVTGGQVEVEYTHAQRNSMLRELESFESMKTRMGRRLGSTEFRVSLYLLDFSRCREAPPYLSEIILHSGMDGSEVKGACLKAFQAIQSEDQTKAPFLRIRKKRGAFPGRIIRDKTKLRDIFLTVGNGELFVQPITTPDNLGEKEFHVLIRHWHPSRLFLAEPFEIKVTHDYNEKIELVIRNEVSACTNIDIGRLEYVVPEVDVDYPYDISPVVLQEKSTWRKFAHGRILNVHTDQCALIVKDSAEVGRELTREERKKYASDQGQFILSPPRKLETGLCINLARTPPQ